MGTVVPFTAWKLSLYHVEDYLRKLYVQASIDEEEYFQALRIISGVLRRFQ